MSLQCPLITLSQKRFNYVVPLFEMTKIWVGRTTLNGGKRGDGLTQMACVCPFLFFRVCVIFNLPSDFRRSIKLKNCDFPPSFEHLFYSPYTLRLGDSR